MQTLISAFNDRDAARRAIERLVQAGFDRSDVHLQESSGRMGRNSTGEDDADNREIADRTMRSAEREIAGDRNAFEAIGHFMVSLFGKDRGEKNAERYGSAVGRGHSLVVVDARNDAEAESAAVILHDCGAVDVDDHEDGRTGRAGVHMFQRAASPSLRELAYQRQARDDSLLAVRAGQVTKEREEKAMAAGNMQPDKDRPH